MLYQCGSPYYNWEVTVNARTGTAIVQNQLPCFSCFVGWAVQHIVHDEAIRVGKTIEDVTKAYIAKKQLKQAEAKLAELNEMKQLNQAEAKLAELKEMKQ